MDFSTALDHARAFEGRIVKPFQKLREVLEAAVEAEGKLKTYAPTLADQERKVGEGQALLTRLEAEVRDAEAKAKARIEAAGRNAQAAEERARAAEARHAGVVAQHQAEEAKLVGEAKQSFEALKAEQTKTVEKLEATIAKLRSELKALVGQVTV